MGEVEGAMLPTPAINVSALSPYFNDGYARWRSRLRKLRRPRNTRYRAARFDLTGAGLSPAGSHQLGLAHAKSDPEWILLASGAIH